MQIVCPHCDTTYDVRDEALKPAGRVVRCARCKETWLATSVAAGAQAYAGGETASDSQAGRPDHGRTDAGPDSAEPVQIESPPLAAGLPAGYGAAPVIDVAPDPIRAPLAESAEPISAPLRRRASRSKMRLGMPGTIAALGAICIAIVMWRTDVVRLMPQTAAFFKALGLGVNVRPLEFAGIRTTSETVNGTTILLIEGEIVARKPTDIPRLRFGLRNAAGAEIHAWNAMAEQDSLGAGARSAFTSRLAAPPPEGREITVRFFSKHDMSSGGK